MLPFMPTFLPGLVQVFPFVLLFTLACAEPLRRRPAPFYLAFTALAALASWSNVIVGITSLAGLEVADAVLSYQAWFDGLSATNPALDAVLTLTTTSYAGVSFFLIVMFTGAMRRTTPVRRLLSVRSELSVLGGIVMFAHVLRIFDFPANFSDPVFNMVWGTPGKELMFAATAVVGPLLTLCFIVPWATSFKFVRRRMEHRTWKRTQLLAYPMMMLMLLQGLLLALGHLFIGYPWDGVYQIAAFEADPAARYAQFAQLVLTAGMYASLLVAYPAMRLSKRAEDRRRKEGARARAQGDGGFVL